MYKLTEFGKILQKKDDYSNYFIITTKDKGSVKAPVIIIQLILIIYFVRMNLIYFQKVR